MIIEKLRASTAQVHKELDLWLMPVFKQVDNRDRYAQMLQAFYGYYAPVMKLITVEMDTQYLPDFTQRRKPSLILEDLAVINKKNIDSTEYAVMLPQIKNASEAFGALYVLEGSTLGGVFLSKMLAENMGVDEHTGLSFFYGYGKESREMWNVFMEQINLFAKDKGNEESILSAASDTFKYFKAHLQKSLQYN